MPGHEPYTELVPHEEVERRLDRAMLEDGLRVWLRRLLLAVYEFLKLVFR